MLLKVDKIVIVTKQGVILKFPADALRTQGRFQRGCGGIKLAEGDCVVAAFPICEIEEG